MKHTKTLSYADYQSIGSQVRGQVLADYRPDSCIETTAAVLDILKKIGVDAFPLAVRVVVVNEPLWKAADGLTGFPAVGTAEYPPDGYAVAVGFPADPQDPKKWPGHLVAIAERQWLLDFSLDQVDRPDFGLKLTPAVFKVSERFLRGSNEETFLIFQQGTTRLYYQTAIADKSFRDTPAWTIHRPKIQFVPQVRKETRVAKLIK